MGSRQQRRKEARLAERNPAPAASRAAGAGDRWRWPVDGPISVAIFFLAMMIYGNSIRNGHVYDDITIIRDNPLLTQEFEFQRFFRTSYWGQTEVDSAALYRPLTIMSFAIDRMIFGSDPQGRYQGPSALGVHIMNVLANGVVAVLAFALLRRWLKRRDVAAVAAGLFAIHPIHTEVVANGVGRAELYASVAMLGAMLMHQRFVDSLEGDQERGLPPSYAIAPLWLIGAMALYFTGMLFKESAAVMPGLVFLGDWLTRHGGSPLAMLVRVWRYLIYAVPLGVYLSMRHEVIGSSTPALQEVMHGASKAQILMHASETLMRYIGQCILPVWMAAEYSDYTAFIRPALTDPMVMASILLWIALITLTIWLISRRQHIIPLGITWFFVAIFPVSNLVIPIGTVRADRLLFTPSLGIVLIIAWLWGVQPPGPRKVVATVLLAALTVFYVARTFARNEVWRSPETLWPATVEDMPGSAVAWAFMGDIHKANNRNAEAEAAYTKSFELRDHEEAGFFYPESHNNLAQLLNTRGDKEGAIAQYRLVLEKRPKQFTALTNLGELLMHDAATREEAISLFQRASEVSPKDFRPLANLAQAYRLAERWDEALTTIDKAIKLNSRDFGLFQIKAEILEGAGRLDEALKVLPEAFKLAPKEKVLWEIKYRVLKKLGRDAEAAQVDRDYRLIQQK